MEINWTEILKTVLELLVIPAVLWLIKEGATFLKSKTNSVKAHDLIDKVSRIVNDAVLSTQQTFVDNIKGTDGWNKEAMQEAFERSMATAIEILGEESLMLLEEIVGDVTAYLKAKIEAAVNELKK